jgi:hypothetical protein
MSGEIPTPENLRWALIGVFRDALDKRRNAESFTRLGSESGKAEDDAIRSQVEAFELASRHGWDYENSEAFELYRQGATDQEILAEGLRMALWHCRPGARLDCNGCRQTFAADGSDGQLTELTGGTFDLLVAGPDSAYREESRGAVFCDACILGLVKGLL